MSDRFNTIKGENTTNTWLTPKWLLDELGEFDLDPCAAPEPRPWDCAKVNISLPEDGLAVDWGKYGRVWCNPPYGSEGAPFLKRMAEHRCGLSLVFVRTDTKVFQEWILKKAAMIFFLRGRLKFCRVDGTPSRQTANAPSCLVAYDFAERNMLQRLERAGFGEIANLNI